MKNKIVTIALLLGLLGCGGTDEIASDGGTATCTTDDGGYVLFSDSITVGACQASYNIKRGVNTSSCSCEQDPSFCSQTSMILTTEGNNCFHNH